MQPTFLRAAALVAALALPAFAGSLPLETPLIVDGPVTVDAGDVEGFMTRVPAERRTEIRASRDRITSIADGIFVARSLAAKARELGLDKDPAMQRRLAQVQDNVLADAYMQHLEKSAPAMNLEPRARELYLADQAKYVVPEQVRVQHLLVGLNGRTREMAEQRAREIHAEAVSGKEDFLALIARHSDDPDKKKNGGDLGYSAPGSFVAPVAQRIAKMSKAGEISEPVESHMGFHIVRFVDRQKPRQMTFDEVKKGIIGQEKERLNKKRADEAVTVVRSSSTVVVHLDKLDAMVVPIDDVLSKAATEAARAAAAAGTTAKPR